MADTHQANSTTEVKKAPPKQPVLRILSTTNKGPDAETGTIDHITLARYKPESLETLCRTTKFTKREIQIMYRGFKQECPTGIVNEDTFKHVYGQFFPQGDATNYAHFVFKTLDKDNQGCITFEEFLRALSELIHGSPEDKLRWAFSLYNQSNTGKITRLELATIITAIYDMMGAKTTPPIEQSTVDQHVEIIMARACGGNGEEEITFDKFRSLCVKDQQQTATTFHEFGTDLRLRN